MGHRRGRFGVAGGSAREQSRFGLLRIAMFQRLAAKQRPSTLIAHVILKYERGRLGVLLPGGRLGIYSRALQVL
jgi:hypothetical protein